MLSIFLLHMLMYILCASPIILINYIVFSEFWALCYTILVMILDIIFWNASFKNIVNVRKHPSELLTTIPTIFHLIINITVQFFVIKKTYSNSAILTTMTIIMGFIDVIQGFEIYTKWSTLHHAKTT